MKSLKKLLEQRQSVAPLSVIQRLEIYIQKKYNFSPEIKFLPQKIITIYAPKPALASLLKLDWANLKQLVGEAYEIKIRLKRS